MDEIGIYKIKETLPHVDEQYTWFRVQQDIGWFSKRGLLVKIAYTEELSDRLLDGARILTEWKDESFVEIVDYGVTGLNKARWSYAPERMVSFIAITPPGKMLIDVIKENTQRGLKAVLTQTFIGTRRSYVKEYRIFLDLAQAIKKLQRYKIAHNDINPWSVFYTDANRAILGDLGQCTTFEDHRSVEAQHLPNAGMRQGYLAPEIINMLSTPRSLESSDIFSLGAVMYHAFTGKPPFEGRNIQEIKARICGGSYQKLSDVVQDLHPKLYGLITRSLLGIPDNRPSIDEIIETLERITPAAQ